jgi:hypothetical protein
VSTKFSHGPEEVVAKLLIDKGLATDPAPWRSWVPNKKGISPPSDPTSAWPVFTAVEPAFPDNVITCYEAEPQIDAKIMVTGEIQTHWGITVRVRGQTYSIARQKAEDIRWDFNENLLMRTVTIGTTQYLVHSIPRVVRVRPILETPTSKRWFCNLNCLAVIQPYPFNG